MNLVLSRRHGGGGDGGGVSRTYDQSSKAGSFLFCSFGGNSARDIDHFDAVELIVTAFFLQTPLSTCSLPSPPPPLYPRPFPSLPSPPLPSLKGTYPPLDVIKAPVLNSSVSDVHVAHQQPRSPHQLHCARTVNLNAATVSPFDGWVAH